MKVCFTGCSFTVGDGFAEDQRANFIYDRLISKELNWDSQNQAQLGNSNYRIFIQSYNAIISQKFDLVISQWSALNRLWLSPGPNCFYATNDDSKDFEYRDLKISKADKQFFKNLVLLLNHDYQNLLDLVDYCNLLQVVSKEHRVQQFNINGLVPWTQDLLKPFGSNLAQEFSSYTKHLLDFDGRDDQELLALFGTLQKKMLTLDTKVWVNMFDSFLANTIDDGPQGHHPGPKSHRWMADQIKHYLIREKIL